MSTRIILNENWSDYDDRKKRVGDRTFFACEETWEVEYLVEKIHRNFPRVTRDQIRSAVSACCLSVRAPRPRHIFVECVMKRLGLE